MEDQLEQDDWSIKADQVKVSARIKRVKFSKFLILRRSDKAFPQIHKKYYFSAELLDV